MPDQEKHWPQLISLMLMHGANHALMVVLFLSPFFPEMGVDLRIENPAKLQLLSTFNLMAYALASFPMGLLGDKYPKPAILAIAMGLNGLVIAGMGLVGGYGGLLILSILAGILGGAFHPISQALITELMPNRKGAGLGIMGIGASLGYIGAPLISERMATMSGSTALLSWQKASVAVGCIGVAVAVMYALVSKMRSLPVEREETLKTRDWTDFPWAFVGTMILVFGLRDIIGYGMYPLASGYYQEDLGFARSNVASLLSLYYLPGLIVQPLFGATSDGLRRERIAIPALGAMGLALFLTPWLVKVTPGLPILFLGGAMSSTVPIIDAFVADGVPPKYRSRAFGLLFTFGIGIGSLGPVILGYAAYQLGFPRAYLIGGFIPLVAAILIWNLARQQRNI
jgi:YNFM family putative membrane transporter